MSRPPLPRLLTAALLASTSGLALALTPDDGAPDIVLYLPGSQANDAFFQPAVCLSGTAHVYFQNNTPADPAKATNNDYWAVYCKTDGSKVSGLTGEKKVWISRRRLGASYVGIDAVANGTKLTYLADPVSANCTAFSGTFTSAGVAFKYDYSCGTVTDGISATASISDVTPDVFHGPDNVPSGKADIDAAKIDNRHAIAGHIIGTPVTLKLRNALQYAQVLNGALPSACAVPGAAVDAAMIETAECMPGLTKQQLASLFSGKVSDWNTFNVNVNGAPKTLGEVAADWIAKGGDSNYLSVPRDTTVHVCRRENGAGQQVALLANILQNPCLGDSMARLIQPGGQADARFATSLGAVDNCLKDFNDGTTGFLPASPEHGNQWAISIQTTERNVNRAANYRFIKIDGAAPTVHQVALGRYPLWSEYGVQWMNSVSADQAKILNAMVAYGQNPVNVAARNAAAVHSFGPAGYVALSSNGYAPDRVFNAANPVNPYTRVVNGVPDACAIPVANPDFGVVELPGGGAAPSASSGAACALPWGGQIAHGQSVVAFAAATAKSCAAVAEARACDNGALSGSADLQSCADAASPPPVTEVCANPALTLASPNGGETLRVGSRQGIDWTSKNLPTTNTVDVYFSANGGSTWKPLKKGVKIGAGYAWKIGNGQATGTGKIQVCVPKSKVFGSICDSSDAVFSVVK